MSEESDERDPKNLDGCTVVPIDDAGIDVFDWYPEPDGKGAPTQVHLLMTPGHGLPQIAMRLKSRADYDRIVRALTEHADRVWPEKQRPPQRIHDEHDAANEAARGNVAPALEKRAETIAASIGEALPMGQGFLVFLTEGRSPGTQGEALVSASNIPREECLLAIYRWIETLGSRGVGPFSLEPTLREAIAILQASRGRAMGHRAITPALGFAIGTQIGIADSAKIDDCDEATRRAITLLESMILAEPIADAEIAAEEAAAAKARS